jgi:hypothetical protein
MGFFRGWSLKVEREQKKNYINICRRLQKASVKAGWVNPAPPGSDNDHSLALETSYLSRCPIWVVTSPLNIKVLPSEGIGGNKRKGSRSYKGAIELYVELMKWERLVEWQEFVQTYADKIGVDFNELIKPIVV